jgi:hypothetical protein
VQNKVYSLIIDNGNFTLYMCRPIFSCIWKISVSEFHS